MPAMCGGAEYTQVKAKDSRHLDMSSTDQTVVVAAPSCVLPSFQLVSPGCDAKPCYRGMRGYCYYPSNDVLLEPS